MGLFNNKKKAFDNGAEFIEPSHTEYMREREAETDLGEDLGHVLVPGSLKPINSLLLVNFLAGTSAVFHASATGNTESLTREHNIEVHSVDTGAGIVLHSEINVLLDSKTKVS